MPKFSSGSLKNLQTCDKRLQDLMQAVLQEVDITILCGTRGEKDQNAAYAAGLSKLKYPNSRHNSVPSMAVDIAPYPIDWNNIQRFKDLAKVVLAKAKELDVDIRWGGDFNMNGLDDDKFKDLPHYEIRG